MNDSLHIAATTDPVYVVGAMLFGCSLAAVLVLLVAGVIYEVMDLRHRRRMAAKKEEARRWFDEMEDLRADQQEATRRREGALD